MDIHCGSVSSLTTSLKLKIFTIDQQQNFRVHKRQSWIKAANLKLYSYKSYKKSEIRHMVDPWSVFCPAFLFWPTWEHISKYVIPILLRMQRACCFSEMAVLRGMICFRRNDAGADRIPNNNHLAMNISPGRVVARMTISQVSDLAHKDISHFVRFIFFFFQWN